LKCSQIRMNPGNPAPLQEMSLRKVFLFMSAARLSAELCCNLTGKEIHTHP
jgi:hypothetical protein